MSIHFIRPLASVLVAFAFASLAEAKTTIPYSETINADGISKIVVKLSAGSIGINATDGSSVDLEVEQVFKTNDRSEAEDLLDEIEKTIERDGDTLRIEFKYERKSSGFWRGNWGNNAVYFDTKIEVPSHVQVELDTNGGHVAVSGLRNRIDARTSGGHMNFDHIEGNIEANTSGGHVNAENIVGDIDLRTSGGHIAISDIVGNVDIRTSGGNVDVTSVTGKVDAKTSGGNIDCSFPNGITEDAEFETSGGGISARVPDDARYHLRAHTSGGGVHLSIDGTVKGDIKNNRADVEVNGGGPNLTLDTSGGSIRVTSL